MIYRSGEEKIKGRSSMNNEKEVRILLIGIGGYGTNYLKELTEKQISQVKIEGVCDVMPDVYERFPVLREREIPVYASPEEFYERHEADLAIISSPIHLHYSQTGVCLNADSHVLCEKPVCTSVKGARALMELEEKTGHFIAVGYQLNYSKEVLMMKQDILKGRFGKPMQMKALHAMSRGSAYYNRNSWAGRIHVNDCAVNDSPFNNACAHQFQLMTFLLGNKLDEAAELSLISGELYRANPKVENFDTAAVHAKTVEEIPLYYYTSHALKEKHLGPISEYGFENGTIYFGRDFGEGPVNKYVAVMNDGSTFFYDTISEEERLKKMYDAIESTRSGGHPVCTIQCAIPHLEAVEQLERLPILPVHEENIQWAGEEDDRYCCIKQAKELLEACYFNQLLPSQAGAGWSK